MEFQKSDGTSLWWRNLVGWLCVLVVLGVGNGCGGQLYRVGGPPKNVFSGLPNGQSVVARKLSGDELMAQFDANLLLAGVVVIEIQTQNRGEVSAPLAFQLRDTNGTLLQPLLPKKALQKVMKFYGNRVYAQAAYQHTLAQYESLALPINPPSDVNAEYRGFLFFAAATDATRLSNMQFVITGLANPITLTLN